MAKYNEKGSSKGLYLGKENHETREELKKRDNATNRVPNRPDADNFEQASKLLSSSVENRLAYLYSLKTHRAQYVLEYREEYKGDFAVTKPADRVDYSMNTGFAIANTKFAEVLANTPVYDFVGMDDDGKRNKNARKLLWDYYWLTSNTDRHLARVVMDAMKYGTGFAKEYIRRDYRTLKIPKYSGPMAPITYEEQTVCEYDAPMLEHIRWENVFLNGTNIDDTTEAAIVKHYDRDEFFALFKNNPMYCGVNDDRIPYGKRYYYSIMGTNKVNDESLAIVRSNDTESTDDNNIVSVLEYYNKAKDQFIVLANGEWINPIGENKNEVCPIPYEHHQIPIIVYTDYMLEDDIYGLGEFDITRNSRRLKNDNRSLIMETSEAMMGLITIGETADFDESVLSLGSRSFARVNKEDIGFFAPNINTAGLQYLDGKVDEDLIIETGIDHRAQLLSPNETATKTDSRMQSARKRVNAHVKFNAYDFYERLARLRSSNIEMLHSEKAMEIFVRGMDIDEDGTARYVDGFGTFTVLPKHVKGKFNVIPVIDSMMGESTERQKARYIEVLQLWGNLVDPDTGKALINPAKLVELGRGLLPGIDVDALLQKTPATKDAAAILDESGVYTDVPGGPPQQAPDVVPPEQRSGAKNLVPTIASTSSPA